jgi:DNA-binding MarR family transcriptional regulator
MSEIAVTLQQPSKAKPWPDRVVGQIKSMIEEWLAEIDAPTAEYKCHLGQRVRGSKSGRGVKVQSRSEDQHYLPITCQLGSREDCYQVAIYSERIDNLIKSIEEKKQPTKRPKRPKQPTAEEKQKAKKGSGGLISGEGRLYSLLAIYESSDKKRKALISAIAEIHKTRPASAGRHLTALINRGYVAEEDGLHQLTEQGMEEISGLLPAPTETKTKKEEQVDDLQTIEECLSKAREHQRALLELAKVDQKIDDLTRVRQRLEKVLDQTQTAAEKARQILALLGEE